MVMTLGASSAQAAPQADETVPPAESPTRPTIFTTEAEIERAKARVQAEDQPFYQSWIKVKEGADAALTATFVPEQSNNHEVFYRSALPQAQAVRDLALAARITEDQRYAQKARQILTDWAQDALAGPYPSAGSEHSAGLVIGRVVPVFADGYAMIWEDVPQSERDLVERWFKDWVTPIKRSREIFLYDDHTCDYGVCRYREPPYIGGNYFSNHLGAHNLGLMAIGFTLGDQRLIRESIHHPRTERDLKALIDGAIIMPDDLGAGPEQGDLYKDDPTYSAGAPLPEPGEIWDRNRITEGSGLHYSHLHLRLLVLQADMVKNNYGTAGRDWFSYVGPQGENFEISFDVYDDFLMTGDSAARTGYYRGSYVDYGLLPLYEIAHREYPGNSSFQTLLESFDRVALDRETFGWSLLLTDGEEGLAIAEDPYPSNGTDSWTFDSDGDLQGFTLRNVSATVAQGALILRVDRADPGIVSRDLLGLPADDYTHIEVTMRNQTQDDTNLTVYFTTDEENAAFDGAKSVMTPVSADDSEFQTYRIDMQSNPEWVGRIRQLRIDPVGGLSPGDVAIDSIRVTQ